MNSTEVIWNLERLIRDGFPKGLPLSQLESQYEEYFQCKLPHPDNPETLYPNGANWSEVFTQSTKFLEWFKLDNKNKINALAVPEKDLRVYFRLARYKQYLMARQGAKIDDLFTNQSASI